MSEDEGDSYKSDEVPASPGTRAPRPPKRKRGPVRVIGARNVGPERKIQKNAPDLRTRRQKSDEDLLDLQVKERLVVERVRQQMLAREASSTPVHRNVFGDHKVQPVNSYSSKGHGKRGKNKEKLYEPRDQQKDASWARRRVPEGAAPQRGDTFVMMHTDTTYRMDYTSRRATIELHGVTEHGNSVMVNINGYDPHFSVVIPDYPYDDKDEYDVDEFMEAFKREMTKTVKQTDRKFDTDAICVVRGYEVSQKEDILNFKGLNNTRRFVKVRMASPNLVPKARKLFESGMLSLPDPQDPANPRRNRRIPRTMTYEANIRYVLRYMVDRRFFGCQWLSLKNVKPVPYGPHRKSRAQIELNVDPDDVDPISLEERMEIAPLLIMSFDIECITADGSGRFPDALHDPCIQIAAHVAYHGDPEEECREYVWTTKPPDARDCCGPVLGASGRPAIVYEFDDERELLCHWARFMRACDPDIVTGYNIAGFDLPFLVGRVNALGIDPAHGLDWSRMIGHTTRCKPHKFESRAFGTKESYLTVMPGRTNFDMYQWFQKEQKLRAYGLNAVSEHVLGDRKEDVPHYLIRPLYMQDGLGRARVAQYCLKDARLPMQLMQKQLALVNYVEMVRVVGVPLCWLLERGQMAKTRSRIMRAAQDNKPHPYMLPSRAPQRRKYRGAIVVEPSKGYYVDPVIILDFASLYPSIMIADNICYTTWFLVKDAEKLGLTEDDYFVPPLDWTKVVDQKTNKEIPAPGGMRPVFAFVKPHIRKGLLPQILEDLLSNRNLAKGQLKAAKAAGQKMLADVFNGKQLALKITANSTYGFTSGMVLPNTGIAESVTAIGRDLITDTKKMVHTRFRKGWYDRGECQAKNIPEEWWDRPPDYQDANNGVDPRAVAGVRTYEVDAEVVYGDTDSVMVRWKGGTVERAWEVGDHMSAYCKQFYKKPHDLEKEAVYYPFLLLKKKKYASLMWTNPRKYDKVQIKGLEGARRDWTLMTVELEEEVLRTLMHERNVPKVKQMIHQACEDLLTNKMDVSKLVISKGFTQPLDAYSKPYPPHIQQVVRMMKRDPSTAPKVGSRVSSIIIPKPKHASAGDRYEDPLYVMQNNLPYDGMHYIKTQLIPPFCRLLHAVFADTNAERQDVDGYYEKHKDRTSVYRELFVGPHMQKRIQRLPIEAVPGTLTALVSKTPTCVVCRKVAIRTSADRTKYSAMCRDRTCRDQSHAVFVRYVVDTADKALRRTHTRQTCVDCQDGTPYEEILCENRNCSNWFTRVKAQIDYDKATNDAPRYLDLINPQDLDW